MVKQTMLPLLLALSAILSPGRAQEPAEEPSEFTFKLASPFENERRYREVFPTEVRATARLWNQLKVDSLREQTEALRIEFERSKSVEFIRDRSLVYQASSPYEGQPSHLPTLKFSMLKF